MNTRILWSPGRPVTVTRRAARLLAVGSACVALACVALACASAGPATSGAAPLRRVPDAGVLDTAAWRGLHVVHVEELLAGRVAGVRVAPGAGGYAIQVRGRGSLVGGTEPLYVIDGTPVTPIGPGMLAGVNPADVVRIEVLKDPADLAQYGLRGGNGVVRITTRRGPRRP